MEISNDNTEIFKCLTTNLQALFLNNSDKDRAFVKKALDDLNKLNFRYRTVENQTDAILLIHSICTHVSYDDSILAPKCCRLITQLINIQKLRIEKRTFNDLMNWCLKILAYPEKQEYETVEVLILLDALIRSSSISIGHYIFTVLHPNSPLFKVLEGQDSPTVQRYGLQFLEACTIIDEKESTQALEKLKELIIKCAHIFQENLMKLRKYDEASDLKIKIICFRGLENILRKFDNITETGSILGIIKYYMLLGVRNSESCEIKPVLPSSLSIPEPESNTVREKKGGKVTKLRKHRASKRMETHTSEEWMKTSPFCGIEENTKRPALAQIITSDSDLSDSANPKAVNLPKLRSRVRQMSLFLLFTMSKKLQQSMLPYWTSFIPEYSGSGKLFLTTCILEDQSMECRSAALNVLLNMLSSSKFCTLQADSCDKTAFTPFSSILGSMLIGLHECLNLALKDKITSVVAQVLKCYAALIEGTPYHRLKPGLITEIVHNVFPLLQHKDRTIETGAFIVIGCILASEPIVEETKTLFLNLDLCENNTCLSKDCRFIQNSTNNQDNDLKALPSVLRVCLNNLLVKNDQNVNEIAPLPVKIESVKVISCLCRNYFDCLVYPYLSYIGKAICDCLSEKNFDLRLHTGRTIDSIGQAMDKFLQDSELGDAYRNGQSVNRKDAPGVTFWISLLNGPLVSLLASNVEAPLRATCCCCLGSIGSLIFENLPIDKHFLIMAYILACTKDEEPSLRSDAVRALGILSQYTILREDTGFLIDVADVLYGTLNDENNDVRLKSSWALGNLSDVLMLNNTNKTIPHSFPPVLMVKLLEKSISAGTSPKNNDKIKANVARAIGNLMHLITQEILQKDEFRNIVESAVDWTIKAASTVYKVKVRWNACYALGLLLKNEAIYIETPTWLESVFVALNNLVSDFKNFKVRTTAAQALASPTKREYYGIHYFETWKSLLKSLEVSQLDIYFEVQQKNRLIEQVCLSLAHLISLSKLDDLSLMSESLNSYYEMFKAQMKRMFEILVPEKSSIIFEAAEHLKAFIETNMNTETKECLLILQDIIVQEF